MLKKIVFIIIVLIPSLVFAQIDHTRPRLHKRAVPTTPTSSGRFGQYSLESGWAYFCIATNTWERVAIASWAVAAAEERFLLLEAGSENKLQLEVGSGFLLLE